MQLINFRILDVKKIVFTACALMLSANALADMVIIVNKNNDSSITRDEVKKLYLGKMDKFSNGNTAIPINLSDSDLKNEFDSSVIGRNSAQVTAYWSKAVFTGAGTPPKQVNDQSEVIKLVSSNPDVIGYVDKSLVTNNVKVITL